jgi:hypothetical protein
MVQPEWVVEISCLDLISQTTRGGTVDRMVLDYRVNGSQRYDVVTRLPLASVISPQFIRRRDDKSVVPQDVRIAQVTDLVEVPGVDRDSRQMTLPAGELLRREVFTKELKGQTMVRKFLLWKTNKESSGDEFPAYVAHYTDFSPNRKDALAREVRVSSSRAQIEMLFESLREANVKSGWQPYAGGAGVVESSATPLVVAAPGMKEAIATNAAAAADAIEPQSESALHESSMAPSVRKKRTPKKKSG